MRRHSSWMVLALLVALVALAIHYPVVERSNGTDGMIGLNYIAQLLQDDLVNDAETAVELAAVLIGRNWGEDTLNEQQPLVGREDGDYWWVEGTPKKSDVSTNDLLVHVQLKKTDASVASLYWTLAKGPQTLMRLP